MAQDEVKFYMGDAASKLLLVPARGNREAEKAAADLNVPAATISVSWSEGAVQPAITSAGHQLLLAPSKCRGNHPSRTPERLIEHSFAVRTAFHGVQAGRTMF